MRSSRHRYFLLFHIIWTSLSLVGICGVSGIIIVAISYEAAADTLISPASTPANSRSSSKTFAAMSTASPPPPEGILVTKRDGSSIELSGLRWVIDHDIPESPSGVPTASGVEVSLDYVTRVELGTPSDKSWPVTITLLDGTSLIDSLGFKARRGLRIEGDTDLGYFKTTLDNVQSIVLRRKTAPKTVPQVLRSTQNVVVIENRTGTRTKVSEAIFRVRCSRGMWCCYGEKADGIPVTDGLNVALAKVKVVEVGEATAGKPEMSI